MRDPNRIDEMVSDFAAIWKQNPDMRFGQLVVNLLGVDPFYIEDDDIKKIFELNKIKHIND